MKNKLTIYDCFKYPNAVIREYKNGKKLDGEYINILQLISFKCLTVWNEPKTQIKDANKYLKNCKLVLKDMIELQESGYDLLDTTRTVESDRLRLLNYDINGMKESGRAVYE